MKLSNLDMIKLLPYFMRDDDANKALSTAVNKLINEPGSRLKNLSVWDVIDELDHNELDELAWELNIDWYKTSLPLESKREVIKTYDQIIEKQGTKWAVETLITSLFGEGKVVEWFEYGGKPYRFKVVTNNATVTTDKATEFIKALESVKNSRSHLEKVEITMTEDLPLYFAGIVHTGDKVITRQVM